VGLAQSIIDRGNHTREGVGLAQSIIDRANHTREGVGWVRGTPRPHPDGWG